MMAFLYILGLDWSREHCWIDTQTASNHTRQILHLSILKSLLIFLDGIRCGKAAVKSVEHVHK